MIFEKAKVNKTDVKFCETYTHMKTHAYNIHTYTHTQSHTLEHAYSHTDTHTHIHTLTYTKHTKTLILMKLIFNSDSKLPYKGCGFGRF